MKVVINGGHCPGMDPGAVGRRVQEANICSDLMKLVAGYLNAVGMETLQVQENELGDISYASNQAGADLFVSIHCNAAANETARGTEVFYMGGEGKKLAECIQQQILDSLGTTDRGVKFSEHLYVLKHTDATSVLVETAFISNEDDETLLITKKDEFARAIARGITDYIK